MGMKTRHAKSGTPYCTHKRLFPLLLRSDTLVFAAPTKPQDSVDNSSEAEKVSGTRVKAILRLLAQEAGFLVNPGVKVMI